MLPSVLRLAVIATILSVAVTTSAKEWTNQRTNETFEAEIESAEPDVVIFRTDDQQLKRVPLADLDSSSRAAARRTLGIALVDMTGVWRSDTGTYYAISEGRGDRVYVTMLESPSLSSIEGTLRRKGRRIIADQWLISVKADPTRKVLAASAQFFLMADGRVRAKFDKYFIPGNGGGIRKRGNFYSAFSRVDYLEIPDRLIAKYFPRKQTLEERVRTLASRIAFWWLANAAADQFDPHDGIGPAVAKVALSRAGDSFIHTGLKEAFPELSGNDIESLHLLVKLVLEQDPKQLGQDAVRSLIVKAIADGHPGLSNATPIVDFLVEVWQERRSVI